MKMKVNTNLEIFRPLHPRSGWDTRGPMRRTAFRYRSYWFAPGVGEGCAAT